MDLLSARDGIAARGPEQRRWVEITRRPEAKEGDEGGDVGEI
jgi:hypothetical protein